MSEEVGPRPVKSTSGMKRLGVIGAGLLVMFLLGFVPMWLKARTATADLAKAEHQLSLVRMQSNLASAAIDARRGEYEAARQGASQFFTSLRAEIDKAENSTFTQAQRGGMQPLFDGRDEVITLLARSDPASAERLTDLFVSYRKLMNS